MKIQRLTLLTLVSTCLLALYGCAPSDSDDSSGGSTLTGPIADLQGVWLTEWYPRGTYGPARDTFIVSGTSITWQRTHVGSGSIEYPDFKTVSTGSDLSVGEITILDDGTIGQKFTYKVQTFDVTLLNNETVESWNFSPSCDVENWQENVSVEILGKNCVRDKALKNTELLNVFKLVDGVLYLGLTYLLEDWSFTDMPLTAYPSSVSEAYTKQ